MKQIIILALMVMLFSCGKEDNSKRCRGAEEAQMLCQVEYVEAYRLLVIPDWVKNQCEQLYPQPGCYLDSSKRHHW